MEDPDSVPGWAAEVTPSVPHARPGSAKVICITVVSARCLEMIKKAA